MARAHQFAGFQEIAIDMLGALALGDPKLMREVAEKYGKAIEGLEENDGMRESMVHNMESLLSEASKLDGGVGGGIELHKS